MFALRILGAILFLLLLGLGLLIVLPGPIAPEAWTPPPAPTAEGVFAPNQHLEAIERLASDAGEGPEGISLDADGRLYAGYVDGRVVRLTPSTGAVEELGNTAGRPLGTVVARDGTVFIADAVKGLVALDPKGKLKVLSIEANGIPFRFVDDVDLSEDERYLYFSDASSRFSLHELMHDLLEHGGTGRLLRYDRERQETEVLLDGLYFPNGVTLGPGDEYVLINETQRYRILRYWLKGERAGTREVLLDNLPGFPDNVSYNGRDRFWVALYAPRLRALDALLPHPWARKLLIRLPAALHPAPAHEAAVLALNLEGQVVAALQDEGHDAYAPITSVEEHGGYLYFGSLSEPAFGRMPLPQDGTEQ